LGTGLNDSTVSVDTISHQFKRIDFNWKTWLLSAPGKFSVVLSSSMRFMNRLKPLLYYVLLVCRIVDIM